MPQLNMKNDPPSDRLAETTGWIFDLDNTLYPADCNLFAQVDQRMGEFIANYLNVTFDQARRVQKDYFHRYGTTLSGLMKIHGLEPDYFLDYVHDIDVSVVPEAPELAAALDRLPGRKFIFTNGSRRHAENVADRLGVLDRFNDVFDIGSAGYVPKPDVTAYQRFLGAFRLSAECAAMFEDMPHNLEAAHALGMVTVLVKSINFDHPAQRQLKSTGRIPLHIDHVTENLAAFLTEIGSRIHQYQGSDVKDRSGNE